MTKKTRFSPSDCRYCGLPFTRDSLCEHCYLDIPEEVFEEEEKKNAPNNAA